MTRKLPKPFQRPGIALQIPGPKKEWVTIPATEVVVGAIVQGHNRGLVTEVMAVHGDVRLYFKNGLREDFARTQQLTVFQEVVRGNSY